MAAAEPVEAGGALTATGTVGVSNAGVEMELAGVVLLIKGVAMEPAEAGGALTTGTALEVAGVDLTIWGGTIEVAGGVSLILKRIGGWLGSHSAPGFIVAWFSVRHFSKTEGTMGGGQVKNNNTAEKLRDLSDS